MRNPGTHKMNLWQGRSVKFNAAGTCTFYVIPCCRNHVKDELVSCISGSVSADFRWNHRALVSATRFVVAGFIAIAYILSIWQNGITPLLHY